MDTVRLVCYKKSYENLEAFAKEAEGYGNYHLLFNKKKNRSAGFPHL